MRYLSFYFFLAIEKATKKLYSFFKILLWTLRYPGLDMSFSSTVGSGAYIKVVKGASVKIGKVDLTRGVFIMAEQGGEIIIHDNVFIGFYSVIVARKRIEIGEGCQVAEFVTIRDQNHSADLNGFSSAAISIGKQVWLGAKVTVTQGVSIADRCVVGANAVVNKSFAETCLIAGVPARQIKLI
jgi:acetyltransferase-like isoleucine patch superfamily enzyme